MLKSRFTFIEAPIYQGQKHFGVSLGPSFVRQMLSDQNFDFNLLTALGQQSALNVQFNIYEELSYLVEREVRRRQLVFIAGGDHSLSIGSVQGLLRYRPELKVLWIDAHGDVNTQATSTTQSFHGMPLSFLLGLDSIAEMQDWFGERLKPENLIYYGLRDLDKAEKVFLDKLQIQHYSTDQTRGPMHDSIIKQICAELKDKPLHISVDADAFDPLLAPATGVPVCDGLEYNNVENLVKNVCNVADVLSFEYVELNPQIFNQPMDVFMTAQIGINLFQEVYHGFNDRLSHSEKSGLHDSPFQLEEQSEFTIRLRSLPTHDRTVARGSDPVF